MSQIHSPTHEEIAQCAYELWQARGCAHGTDTELWLEAERSLRAAGHARGAEPHAQNPAALAAQVANQKNAARAPQQQHGKNVPRNAPAESGKPLWDKPHSS